MAEAKNYSVTIKECSKELSVKERIQIKEMTDCIKLDKATMEGDVVIDVDYYATLEVHNDKADDKDYETYVIVDKNGAKYSTGSNSFMSSFLNIYNEIKDEGCDWQLKAYRMPSSNRPGKDFITCSII